MYKNDSPFTVVFVIFYFCVRSKISNNLSQRSEESTLGLTGPKSYRLYSRLFLLFSQNLLSKERPKKIVKTTGIKLLTDES